MSHYMTILKYVFFNIEIPIYTIRKTIMTPNSKIMGDKIPSTYFIFIESNS